MSDLVGTPEDRLSHVAAPIIITVNVLSVDYDNYSLL